MHIKSADTCNHAGLAGWNGEGFKLFDYNIWMQNTGERHMQDPAYKQILGANETLLANAVGGDNLRVFDMELYVCTHHQTLAPIECGAIHACVLSSL